MKRFICIHGHFYQPPRENPWLEAIEQQDSAYPYHDWNERITAECYGPNAVARMLDESGRITRLVNNYARISFNLGPTLLSWLELKAPDVYRAILDADRESRKRFSGHGSALAQAYNHLILPLASRRDKHTQVQWGIRDFEHRFGRPPEGMWLPETAADLETLDVLAELGLRFTILSPYQAGRARKLGEEHWHDVTGGRIDPTMAYLQKLPSGRSICLFFYDGPIARAVAFERLLDRGEYLSNRLLGAFADTRGHAQLVHIATDGESYGHHHTHGDMALAYALDHIEANPDVRLTNYGEFLAKHLPTHEVQIVENTSWSCGHGVERWRSNCGCSLGRPGWNQDWRGPLRQALDWLRDRLASPFEARGRKLLKDPWAARNDYIQVLVDRSPENIEQFLGRHALRKLNPREKSDVLKLMEMQRHLQLMYTSCGWFFDELSGIETVQIIQYAGRAVQLGQEALDENVEEGFLARLELARSNLIEHRDGRHVYEKFVGPAAVDWEKIGAHYAISSLFEDYPDQVQLFCYTAEREDYQSFESGKTRLVVGQVRITSALTRESALLAFGVLHFGDHNISGGVREFPGEKAYRALVHDLSAAFERADLTGVIRLVDRSFGDSTYSLRSLFRDEQRKVVRQVLRPTLSDVEAVYRRVFEEHQQQMRFLTHLDVPLPRALQLAVEYLFNSDLRAALCVDELDVGRIRDLLDRAASWHVSLETAGLGYAFRQTIDRLAERWRKQPEAPDLVRQLDTAIDLTRTLPFAVNLWKPQNVYFELRQSAQPVLVKQAEAGDEPARAWLERFVALGEKLHMR